MTQFSEVIPMNTAVQMRVEQTVSDGAALFISNELFPMMIGFWPKSANQINSNLIGNGIAYGLMIKGIPAGQVKSAVVSLAEREPSREYAPEPQLLKRLCTLVAGNQERGSKPEASIRSLEMQAQVMALNGEISDSEVPATVNTLRSRYEAKGFVITGRVV